MAGPVQHMYQILTLKRNTDILRWSIDDHGHATLAVSDLTAIDPHWIRGVDGDGEHLVLEIEAS